MKYAIWALILLASLSAIPASAQTIYPLPNSGCSIQASDYLYCSLTGNLTINGTRYSIWTVSHISGIYTYPASAPVLLGADSDITFQNLTTGVEDAIFYTSAIYSDHQFTATFSGDFTGSVTFELVQFRQTPPCYRGCRTTYQAENIVLTID